jgi:hypothetical protein
MSGARERGNTTEAVWTVEVNLLVVACMRLFLNGGRERSWEIIGQN